MATEPLLKSPNRKKMKLCCHHGDFDRQNNLASAIVIMDENPQIDIYEIDFIDYGGQCISSHDYKQQNILNGSSIRDWIREICVKRKKILYVDLKVDVGLGYLLSFSGSDWKFNCVRLFNELNRIHSTYQRKKNVDIKKYIWLTSQDYDVAGKLYSINNHLDRKHRWKCIIDAPYVNYYILQYLVSGCSPSFVNDRTYNACMEYNFDNDIIALDYSFFGSNITKFIKDSTIKAGSTIILYSFELGTKPIEIEGYYIIMTYNYRRKKRVK